MTRSRGCGCVVLILGLLNLVVAASTILAFFTADTSKLYAAGMLLVFAGNSAVCFILGRDALRRQTPTADTTEEGVSVPHGEEEREGEGEDADDR